MHTLVVSRHGKFRTDVDPSGMDHLLNDPANLIWFDVQNPTDDDFALLQREFDFHPLALEDAIRSHERPKVDRYAPNGAEPSHTYYFVVFYAVRYLAASDHIEQQALNMFIGPNFLVTVHHVEIPEIAQTVERWQTPGGPIAHKLGPLVHALVDSLVDEYFPVMDQIADRVEDLEDEIFIHFDEAAIETIFRLKKDLLGLRRVLAPERDVMNVLLRREIPIFEPSDMVYLQDVYDHIVRVTDSLDTYRDLLSSALDSYLSLQSNRLNQIMKLLTIASIVLMSNSLIAGIYGMNFHVMPELGWRLGYVWALGLMLAITAGLILYFRRKKWLS